MKSIRIISLLVIGILTTTICLLTTPSHTLAESRGPYKYKCEDGRIFTITFIKEKSDSIPSKARLIFLNSKSPEILLNGGGASGIHYGNEKYIFNEQRGKASLDDFTKPEKGGNVYNTPCREIK